MDEPRDSDGEEADVEMEDRSDSDAASDEDEELEIVQCVCGAKEEDGGLMVACDDCGTWQHADCVGLTPEEAETTPSYLCSNCDSYAYNERTADKAFAAFQAKTPATPASTSKKAPVSKKAPAPKKAAASKKTRAPKKAAAKTSTKKKGTAKGSRIASPSPSPSPPYETPDFSRSSQRPTLPDPVIEEEQYDELYQQGPSLMELYATSSGQNHRKFMQATRDVQLHHLLQPPAPGTAYPSVFRQAFPQKKREMFATVFETDIPRTKGRKVAKRWVVHVADEEKRLLRKLDGKRQFSRSTSGSMFFELLAVPYPDRIVAEKLRDEIKDTCERIPLRKLTSYLQVPLPMELCRAVVTSALASGIAGPATVVMRSQFLSLKTTIALETSASASKDPRVTVYVDHWAPNGTETPEIRITKILDCSIISLAEATRPPPLHPAYVGELPREPLHEKSAVSEAQATAALEVLWWIQSVLYNRIISSDACVAYAHMLRDMLGYEESSALRGSRSDTSLAAAADENQQPSDASVQAAEANSAEAHAQKNAQQQQQGADQQKRLHEALAGRAHGDPSLLPVMQAVAARTATDDQDLESPKKRNETGKIAHAVPTPPRPTLPAPTLPAPNPDAPTAAYARYDADRRAKAAVADHFLYAVDVSSPEVFTLRASTLGQADVAFGALNEIQLPRTITALYRVKEAINGAYIESGDVMIAWAVGNRRADFETQLLDDPQGESQIRCHHTAKETQSGTHPCDRCFIDTRCIDLQWFGTLRICTRARCRLIEPGGAPLEKRLVNESNFIRLARKHGVNSAEYLLRVLNEKARTLVYSDKLTGLDSEEVKALVAGIASDMDQAVFFDETENRRVFRHGYTGTTRPLVFKRGTAEETMPFDFTTDRLYPFTTVGGKVRFHARNIMNCAMYLNLLKHTYPPILLKIIRELRLTDNEEVRTQLTSRLDHLPLIMIQHHFYKSVQQDMEINDETMEALRAQWQTGNFLEATPKAATLRLGVGQRLFEVIGVNVSLLNLHGYSPTQMDGVDTDWMQQRLSEMETQFQARIGTISGVPYPFGGSVRPSYWAWSALVGIFTYKVATMTNWCNKDYNNRTSPERLFATYCRQILNPSRTGDCLGIPLVPTKRSPGSVSIGKVRHKQEMLDGWPQREDESMVPLADIIAADFDESTCNMNYEAWITNVMRGSVSWEPLLDAMLQDLYNILDENLPHWPADLGEVSAIPTEFELTMPCNRCRKTERDCTMLWPCEPCTTDNRRCHPHANDGDQDAEEGKQRVDAWDEEELDYEEAARKTKPSRKKKAASQGKVGTSSTAKAKGKGRSKGKGKGKAESSASKPSSHAQASPTSKPTALVKLPPKPAPPPPPSAPLGPPPYKNLTNLGGTCYLASPLHWLAHIGPLRALLNNPDNFPCNPITGRPDAEREGLDDEASMKHRQLVGALVNLVMDLDGVGDQLPALHTRHVLDLIQALNAEFRNHENDTGDLFSWILDTLNWAGDRSAWRHQQDSKGQRLKTPLEAYQHEQDARIRAGVLPWPLEDERHGQYAKYLGMGNQSPITDLFALQIVRENECPVECMSPFSRSWEVACMLQLAFPRDEKGKYRKDEPYTMRELLLAWQTETYSEGKDQAVECLYNKNHPRRKLSERKIVRTPKLLVVRLDRVGVRRDCNANLIQGDLDEAADIITAHLHLEEYLDLFEFCDLELPSEKLYGNAWRAKNRLTAYRLVGAVQYRHSHYVSYVRVQDSDGTYRFALFDDTKPRPAWENPLVAERSRGVFEFVLIYEQLDRESQKRHRATGSADAPPSIHAPSTEDAESPGEEDTRMGDTIVIGSSEEPSSSPNSDDEDDESDEDPVQSGRKTRGGKFGVASGVLLDAAASDSLFVSEDELVSGSEDPDDEQAERLAAKAMSTLVNVAEIRDAESISGLGYDDVEMWDPAQIKRTHSESPQTGSQTAPPEVKPKAEDDDADAAMHGTGNETRESARSPTPDAETMIAMANEFLMEVAEDLPQEQAKRCRGLAAIFANTYSDNKAEKAYNRAFLVVYDRLGESNAIQLEQIVQAQQESRARDQALEEQIRRWKSVKAAQEEELRLALSQARADTQAAQDVITERDALRREVERLRGGTAQAPAPVTSRDVERHLRSLPLGELSRANRLVGNLLDDAIQHGGQTAGTVQPGELPVAVEEDTGDKPRTYQPTGLQTKASSASLKPGHKGKGSLTTLNPGGAASTAGVSISSLGGPDGRWKTRLQQKESLSNLVHSRGSTNAPPSFIPRPSLRSITPEAQVTTPEKIKQPRRPAKDSPAPSTPTTTRLDTDRDPSPSPGGRRPHRARGGLHTPRQDRKLLERLSEEPPPKLERMEGQE
ncbi:hypothetical protein LTR85_004442 [Meristemomyces frigidus]|nr:hypothetical protein LTR85_004442 [Meristemomyces frigidus]